MRPPHSAIAVWGSLASNKPQSSRKAGETKQRAGFLTLPCLSPTCAGAAPRNGPASEEPETPQPQACMGPQAVSGPTTTSSLWLQLEGPGVRRIKSSHNSPCSQIPPDTDDLGSSPVARLRPNGRTWGLHLSFLVAQGPGPPGVPARAGWADRGSRSRAPGQGRLFKTLCSSQLKQTCSPWKHSLTAQSLWSKQKTVRSFHKKLVFCKSS